MYVHTNCTRCCRNYSDAFWQKQHHHTHVYVELHSATAVTPSGTPTTEWHGNNVLFLLVHYGFFFTCPRLKCNCLCTLPCHWHSRPASYWAEIFLIHLLKFFRLTLDTSLYSGWNQPLCAQIPLCTRPTAHWHCVPPPVPWLGLGVKVHSQTGTQMYYYQAHCVPGQDSRLGLWVKAHSQSGAQGVLLLGLLCPSQRLWKLESRLGLRAYGLVLSTNG